jgi:hypothetical protein
MEFNSEVSTCFPPVICLLKISIKEIKTCKNLFAHMISPKRPLGRPRRRWEDNIKADLQGVGCGGIDWIELAQNRDR